MRLDISRFSIAALGLTAALAATACGDDTGGAGGGSGGSDATSGSTGDTTASTGTGSGVDCSTLCSTYGAAVPAVVDQIVADALASDEFVDDFTPLAEAGDARVTEFKLNLSNFISDAYGCTTGAYEGPSMEDSHAGQDITSQEYDDFVALCAGSLATAGVPADFITECFAPGLTAPALKSSIVGK